MAWLDDHPPQRSQFRDPRRERPSGVIVVHTAENVMDSLGPDTGAEGVANFIRTRDTPGSYHDLVDSDSTMHMVRFTCEAFQDGTGSNPHAYAVSFACRTTDWRTMAPVRRNAFIEHGANAAAVYVRWVKDKYGIVVPARRISRPQSEARVPGFISHAERDPGRRSDPGGDFPWAQFLTRVGQLSGAAPSPTPPSEDDDVRYIVKGTTKGEWFITDGITKRYINDVNEANVLAYIGLAKWDNGKPIVLEQAVVDDITTVPRGKTLA